MQYMSYSGQSAIEYLMTYGWMLLVVAIVGGAIFSVVGEQNIENVQGFDSNNINVEDFGASKENGLMFSMNDPVGQTEVKKARVSNPDTSNVTYILNQAVSEQNNINLPGINPSSNSNELEVEIIYNTGNLENLSTTGTVNGNIEMDKNFNNRTVILDGLAGYWPMKENYVKDSKALDISKQQNHGTMQGTRFVEDGEAINFNGEEDYIDADNPLIVPEHDSFSMVLWFKSGEKTSSEPDIIAGPRRNTDNGWGVYNDIDNNGEIRFEVNGDNNLRDDARVNGLSLNEWYFTYLEFSEKNINIAVFDEDGAQIDSAETDYTDEGNVFKDKVSIGKRDGDSSRRFNGSISSFSIYERDLSEEEVQIIHSQRN